MGHDLQSIVGCWEAGREMCEEDGKDEPKSQTVM